MKSVLFLSSEFWFGAVHIVRTHRWGEGGVRHFAYAMRTRGRGGVKASAYVRRAKFLKFVVFPIIRAFSSAQNTFLSMRLNPRLQTTPVGGELPSDPT